MQVLRFEATGICGFSLKENELLLNHASRNRNARVTVVKHAEIDRSLSACTIIKHAGIGKTRKKF